MPRFEEGMLWELAGPAEGVWHALTLSTEHEGAGRVPEVIVVPARAGVKPWEDIEHDVVCPADASPTGEALVFAAWAVAPIPSHCLKHELGPIPPVIIALIKRCMTRDSNLAKHRRRSRAGEPAWHGELRESLMGYWDGSVMISCATLPTGVVDPS